VSVVLDGQPVDLAVPAQHLEQFRVKPVDLLLRKELVERVKEPLLEIPPKRADGNIRDHVRRGAARHRHQELRLKHIAAYRYLCCRDQSHLGMVLAIVVENAAVRLRERVVVVLERDMPQAKRWPFAVKGRDRVRSNRSD